MMISPIWKVRARAYSMLLEATGKPMQPIGGFVCRQTSLFSRVLAVYKTLGRFVTFELILK